MSDSPLPQSPGHQRLKLYALILLVLVMALTSAGSLWMVIKQARQLALPNLNSELWQAYQIHAQMGQLIQHAQQLLDGDLDSDELVVRLQVLRSLTQNVRSQELFTHLPLARPSAERTLLRIVSLSRDWDSRAAWGDRAAAMQIAREVLEQLPPLQQPMHEVVVATNISRANALDVERQSLHRKFIGLGWTLLALLLGGTLLVLRLIGNYREANRLSLRLSELNQHLELRVAERTAELSEGRTLLSNILEASPSDVALIDCSTEQVYFVNARLLQRLNLASSDEFSLQRLFASPREALHFREALQARHRVDDWEGLMAGEPPYWGVVFGRQLEYRGRTTHLIWSYDISLRKKMEQDLLVLANTDALTGLNNRHAFIQHAETLLRQAERFGHPGSLLMLDIDHFKRINDRHGHLAGDRALATVAQALKQGLRDVDAFGRLGGEEFAVLLSETDQQRAGEVAERLRASVEALRLPLPDDSEVCLTLSIGMASIKPGDTLADLLGRADKALYQAKAAGRNRIERAPD